MHLSPYIYIYIYILKQFMDVTISLGGLVLEQMWYHLESALYVIIVNEYILVLYIFKNMDPYLRQLVSYTSKYDNHKAKKRF